MNGLPGGVQKTARCVQLYQKQLRVLGLRLLDRMRDDLDRDRMDHAVHRNAQHLWRAATLLPRSRERQYQGDQRDVPTLCQASLL